jgi:hypothetical protein
LIQRCLQGLDLRVGSQLQMPNGSLKTSAHLLALKVFIIIAWAATCERMVLKSSIAIVRISLFGIPAGSQVPFAQSSFSWVQIEPFANALLD